MRRVIQFSTGNVGQHSLRAIIGRPDLELVGVHAASPNKIGRDAAELCGLERADRHRRDRRHRRADCAEARLRRLHRAGRDATDGSPRADVEVPCRGHQRRGHVDGVAGDAPSGGRLAAGTTGKGVQGGQRVAVCERHRPRLLGRHRGAQRAEPGHPRHVSDRPGDLRLRQLRRLRVHRQVDGVRDECRRGPADALPAGRPHHDVGRSGAQSRRPTRRGTRRGSATHRAVVRRPTDRVQDGDGRARPDGRGPLRGRGGARRGSGDHHGTHHAPHPGLGARLGVSARRQDGCPPRRGRGGPTRRAQHTRLRPGARRHRGGMRLHRGPGGQRDRLDLPRACKD